MNRMLVLVGLSLLLPLQAYASNEIELNAYLGYNLGGTIDVREGTVDANKLETASSLSTGLSLTFIPRPSFAFELAWYWRPTDVEARPMGGGDKQAFLTLNAHDFQVNFLFMPAYTTGRAIPFLLLGLGATLLAPGDLELESGETISLDSKTKFSWAIGGGLKTYASEKVGFRAQIRYHSTYISEESGGVWCDPYFGCYETVDTNWLDEWDFQGAILFRLGQR